MEKQITDKTHIVVLMGGMRIWITEQECNLVKNAIYDAKKSFVEISESIINKSSILYVGSRANIDEADKIKRGDWKCDKGFWHTRGQECGHNLPNFKKL
jgi:hypothetical protein